MVLGWWLGPSWSEPSMAPFVVSIRTTGVVFLACLKALMVPLVVVTMVLGVQQQDRERGLARLATTTGAFFVSTTFLAVLTGLFLVTTIHPGQLDVATDLGAHVPTPPTSALDAIAEVITGMFPANIVAAASSGNVLGLIVVSLVFGFALSRSPERSRPVVAVLEGISHALFEVVRWVIWLAPIGICALVADRLGRAGGGDAVLVELQRLMAYSLTVIAGLAIHAFVVLPSILWILTRRNPLRYFAAVGEALLTAFGTASSAATLAVTMRCVVERAGVSRKSADFVLPIGATVNMDGTALYEAVAAVFIAQMLGIELDTTQLVVVALTATLAAIGAAAIPEAGLVTMVLVLQAVGLPAEGVGLLLAVDWILDRFRTTVNVWGDTIGAAVIDRRVLHAS